MDDGDDALRMLLESTRAFVSATGDMSSVRAARARPAGFDPAEMTRMAELGWLLMRLEEDHGGLGLGMQDFCALMHVLGRGLRPEPILSSILACALLQDQVPEDVLTGEALIVTAWQDRVNSLDWQGCAGESGLEGAKVHVPGAAAADYFAVTTSEGTALVPRTAAGLSLDLAQLQDGCLTGDLRFDHVAVAIHPSQSISRRLDEATLAHAAYLLGVSERAFEMTLDYLRVREQFGRPIGSFQALQHRAADLKIQIELSRAAIFATARRMDGEAAETAARDVSRCKIRASDLALRVANEAVQMHGAIGIADEADIGLFVSKAVSEANHFGAARLHRRRLVAALGREAA